MAVGRWEKGEGTTRKAEEFVRGNAQPIRFDPTQSDLGTIHGWHGLHRLCERGYRVPSDSIRPDPTQAG